MVHGPPPSAADELDGASQACAKAAQGDGPETGLPEKAKVYTT